MVIPEINITKLVPHIFKVLHLTVLIVFLFPDSAPMSNSMEL